MTVVADAPSISDRYGDLGSMLGESFRKRWHAEPLPGQQNPARVSWSECDGFGLSRAEMPPLRLESTPIDGKRATRYYVYSSNQETQLERDDMAPLRIGPGDLLVLSNAIQTRWTMQHQYVCMNAVIEADIFHKYVRDPDSVVGRRFRFAYGLNTVLLGLVDSAWAMALEGRFARDSACLVRTFLETLAFALDGRMAPPRDDDALVLRREQAKQYIQVHFRSERLTVAEIANELGISTRYVQLAFAQVDQSPRDYLRNIRLAAAAAQLQDPARQELGITRIAFDCGFGSSAHFATEFRRRYGCSPREFRAAALDRSDCAATVATRDGRAKPSR